MSIGAFSVSLNVKDIKASKEFYEKLGFTYFHGELDENWLLLKNDECIIGLFQNMIEKNLLTFNPGWDSNGQEINPYKDVRVFQEELREKGITFITEADTAAKGPGSFIIEDPDGNPILIDQHR